MAAGNGRASAPWSRLARDGALLPSSPRAWAFSKRDVESPIMNCRAPVAGLLLALVVVRVASAEVVRIEIQKRIDEGRYERLIGRVYFAVDPLLPANRAIADLAARSAEWRRVGRVLERAARRPAQGRAPREWHGLLRDRESRPRSVARSDERRPVSKRVARGVGPRRPFHGRPGIHDGVSRMAVRRRARAGPRVASAVGASPGAGSGKCGGGGNGAADPGLRSSVLRVRATPCANRSSRSGRGSTRPAAVVPRNAWRFGPNGCSVQVETGLEPGLYEAVYEAKGSPVAGLGLAAVRDFASYLKHGASGAALRDQPAALQRVLGFGYSQSGRFLREFVRDGFNADEHGRQVFDAMMIASAGAGGGSFNHRFAMPGQAGNSVLSILRPVDLPPFTDDGLMVKARDARVTPKIFYTFSSTEVLGARRLADTHERGRPHRRAAGRHLAFVFSGGRAARLRAAATCTPARSSVRAQLCRPAMGPARVARRSAGVDPVRHPAAVLAVPDRCQ